MDAHAIASVSYHLSKDTASSAILQGTHLYADTRENKRVKLKACRGRRWFMDTVCTRVRDKARNSSLDARLYE